MPRQVHSNLTQALREFGTRAGAPFAHEPIGKLAIKFAIYTLFEEDWEHIFMCTFEKDPRIVKQVKALRELPRASMPALDRVEAFRLLRNIVYKHKVHPETHEVHVHDYGRHHRAHHYHAFAEKLQKANPKLSAHRDTLFLLHLAHPERAEDILYDRAVNRDMGLSHEEVDQQVMPLVLGAAQTEREPKLTDLSHILRHAAFDESAVDVALLQRVGALPVLREQDDANYRTDKATHRDRVRDALKQRNDLLETADGSKLDGLDAAVRAGLNYAPAKAVEELKKAELIQVHATLSKICAVLEQVQLDGISKHRHNLSAAQAKIAERDRLINTADQQALYGLGLGEVLDWQPRSLTNINPNDLGRLVRDLDRHIGQLQNHQIESQ